jgi:hypothetical protein
MQVAEEYILTLASSSTDSQKPPERSMIRVDNALKGLTFKRSMVDEGLYLRQTRHGTHVVCVHVDDIVFVAPDKTSIIPFNPAVIKHNYRATIARANVGHLVDLFRLIEW